MARSSEHRLLFLGMSRLIWRWLAGPQPPDLYEHHIGGMVADASHKPIPSNRPRAFSAMGVSLPAYQADCTRMRRWREEGRACRLDQTALSCLVCQLASASDIEREPLSALSMYKFSRHTHEGRTGSPVYVDKDELVLSALYAVMAVVWIYSEPLFRALGQEEFICVQSPRLLRILIPGGLGYVWFECLKKYLTSTGIY